MLGILLAGSLMVGCSNKAQSNKPDFSGVDEVCNLATYECYYHNVADGSKDASGIFAPLLNTGYKKLWIEYDGVAKIGIDFSDGVKVEDPNAENVVKVHIPDAKVLEVSVDRDSMTDPITESGFFTEITLEEKTTAFEQAQKEMRETAEKNKALLNQATERAKQVIEGYIINVGNTIGQEYTVEFV